MKKNLLTLLFLCSAIAANAQTTDSTSVKNTKIDGNNELKINLAYTIGGFPEINYERILKDDMSIGLAVMVGLEDDAEYGFGVIPNFRVYFGGKKANGFFIEGNAAVVSSNYGSYYYYDYTTNTSTYYGNKKTDKFRIRSSGRS